VFVGMYVTDRRRHLRPYILYIYMCVCPSIRLPVCPSVRPYEQKDLRDYKRYRYQTFTHRLLYTHADQVCFKLKSRFLPPLQTAKSRSLVCLNKGISETIRDSKNKFDTQISIYLTQIKFVSN